MSPPEELRATVERLRGVIASGAPLEGRDRAMLDSLLAAFSELSDDAADSHESLAERLREATEHFEESHPDLTFAIGAVADALARMGI